MGIIQTSVLFVNCTFFSYKEYEQAFNIKFYDNDLYTTFSFNMEFDDKFKKKL